MSRTDLAQLLANTRYVLLDFDGPVCSVFAKLRNIEAADRLRVVLAAKDVPLPAEVAETSSPFAVFEYAASLGRDLGDLVEAELRNAEVDAVHSATATPGATEVLDACRTTRRPVAIASNNSAAAVSAYLARQGLTDAVAFISARADSDPALLKPNPHLVQAALQAPGDAHPTACVFVGDSAGDIEAAKATGVRSLGYANKPGKDQRLAAAGADAVIATMHDLARGLVAP